MNKTHIYILIAAAFALMVIWLSVRTLKRIRDPEVSLAEKVFGLGLLAAGAVAALTGFPIVGFGLLVLALVLLSGVHGFTVG